MDPSQVESVARGEYVVTLRVLRVGSFHVYVASGTDLLSEYPAPLTVVPSLSMGARSFPRLSAAPWFAGMSPAEFELVGVDVYGNAMTTGNHAGSVLVTTTPETVSVRRTCEHLCTCKVRSRFHGTLFCG